MCSLIANDTFINDPRACNAWIQCVDGVPISGTCATQLFYDRNTNTCVPSDTIKCISSNLCAPTAGANAFVADPVSCNGYYYCNNGIATHGSCTPGMNFNPKTSDCIRNFPCSLPMDANSYCNIVPDGVFIKNTANCDGYQLCWDGDLINGTCPGTLYFDAAAGTCNNPQDVECTEQATNPPGLDAEIICPEPGAFIADNTTCNGYYYCMPPVKNGGPMSLVWAECPNGRFFDPANGGSCIARTQMECGYNRCVGMGVTQIQLANESNDDCFGFAICQNGIQIGSGNCPNGNYFDELTQLCTETVISYPSCALSPETTSTTTVTDNVEES